MDLDNYESFDGICLTDTFQLGEDDGDGDLFSEMFPQNSERVTKQKKAPLRVIMGNPPYSIGQKSANDNAQNQSYENLDQKIRETYADASNAGLSKSLYNPYIKAFRWSTDRLDPENGGVIGFITNGRWLDSNSTDGFRKTIVEEFSSIYVLNLRGNQRTSNWRKEGGKIFGSGSQNAIAVTFLVNNPEKNGGQADVYYKDIGDYLSKEEKLEKVENFESMLSDNVDYRKIEPNEEGDWLNKRNKVFSEFEPLAPGKKFNHEANSIFITYANGVVSSRDSWVYNFSEKKMLNNVRSMLETYNRERERYHMLKNNDQVSISDFVDNNPQKISWSVKLSKDLGRNRVQECDSEKAIKSLYRPFTKQNLYFDRRLIERPSYNDKFFPDDSVKNLAIGISGKGSSKGFSPLIIDSIFDFQTLMNGIIFPLYHYEEREKNDPNLFDEEGETELVAKDGISDHIYGIAQKIYGKRVTKEDIFYYVYGILHSQEYKSQFKNDLKKMLPHIPLVNKPKNFWAFSKSGRDLANLHLNYESVDAYEGVDVIGADAESFKVEKLRFGDDKSTIIYNNKIKITNIPKKAYEYEVNGRSAIEWIMDRYQVSVDKKSGIKNDPNDWAEEVGNPRYILDLLLSVINVSVQTVDIVNDLPDVDFEDL